MELTSTHWPRGRRLFRGRRLLRAIPVVLLVLGLGALLTLSASSSF